MNILVDQDGVLADFELAFYKAWQESAQSKEFPAIEIEKRNIFYVAKQYPQRYREFVYEIILNPGFFENLPVITGAVEALNAMREAGHEVIICTSPLSQWQNCVAEKFAWVEANLGSDWTNRMILTKDKTLVRGDVLIDDKPVITGLMTPTWQHILYDSSYNRPENNIALKNELENKPRLTWKNWQEIIEKYQK